MRVAAGDINRYFGNYVRREPKSTQIGVGLM